MVVRLGTQVVDEMRRRVQQDTLGRRGHNRTQGQLGRPASSSFFASTLHNQPVAQPDGCVECVVEDEVGQERDASTSTPGLGDPK